MEIPIIGAIKKNKKAKEIVERAKNKYSTAEKRLERQRKYTANKLNELGETKLEIWANDIGDFLEVYKYFKEIRIEENISTTNQLKNISKITLDIQDMKVSSVNAMEIVKGGVASLGAGVLSGVGAYGGVMMLGTASTGASISALSGIAAHNATLAYLGGGSLAAGGAGMAGGTIVLGGVVVIPILLVASSIMSAKAEENLAQAEKTYEEAKNAAEKMNLVTDFMSHVEIIATDYISFLYDFRKIYCPLIAEIRSIVNRVGIGIQTIDFEMLNINQKKTLQIAWLLTQVLYQVLKAPLLTQKGDIEVNAQKTLEVAHGLTNDLTKVYYEKGEISSSILEKMEELNNIGRPKNFIEKIRNYFEHIQFLNLLDRVKMNIENPFLEKVIKFLRICFCSGLRGYVFLFLLCLGIYTIISYSLLRGLIWLFAGYIAYPENQKDEELSTILITTAIVFLVGLIFL